MERIMHLFCILLAVTICYCFVFVKNYQVFQNWWFPKFVVGSGEIKMKNLATL